MGFHGTELPGLVTGKHGAVRAANESAIPACDGPDHPGDCEDRAAGRNLRIPDAYAKDRPYRVKPARSLFIDGEIALMMGARRMLEEEPAYKQPMTERLKLIEERWRANPIMAAESYPDECWTFDHAVALAAFKVADRLDGTDHSALCQKWIEIAKEKLVHKETGLLV